VEFNREVNVTCAREHWTFGEEWCIQEGGICYEEEMMPKTPNLSEVPRKAAESRKKRMNVAAAKKVLKQANLTGKKRKKSVAFTIGEAIGSEFGRREAAKKAVSKAGAAGFKAGKALNKHPESRRGSRD
jgi:hypothetical protein